MTETSENKYKNIVVLILKFAVIAAAFIYLIYSDKLNFSQLEGVFNHPLYLGLGIVLSFFPMVMCFVRYKYLLRAVGIDVPLSYAFRIGFIGCFFNTFMLGGMGGDIVKIGYLIKDTGKKSPVIAATMIDRIIGLFGMISVAGFAIFLSFSDILGNAGLHTLVIGVIGVIATVLLSAVTSLTALVRGRRAGYMLWCCILLLSLILMYFVIGSAEFTPVQHVVGSVDPEVLLRSRIIVALAVALVVSFSAIIIVPSCQDGRSLHNIIIKLPLGKFFMSFLSNFLMYKNDISAVILGYALSIILQFLNFIAFYFFSKCVVLPNYPQLIDIFFAAPLAFVANTLPIPGGGLGVGETAFNGLLELCRTPEGASITGGAAIFLLWRFWNYIYGIVFGLPLYLKGKKEIDAAEDAYIHDVEE